MKSFYTLTPPHPQTTQHFQISLSGCEPYILVIANLHIFKLKESKVKGQCSHTFWRWENTSLLVSVLPPWPSLILCHPITLAWKKERASERAQLLSQGCRTTTSSGSFSWSLFIRSWSLLCSSLPLNQIKSYSRLEFLLASHQPKPSGCASWLGCSKAGWGCEPASWKQRKSFWHL